MMKKGLPLKSTPFTGRTRVRKTTRGVKFANVTARLLISLGGIAIILAVLLEMFSMVSENVNRAMDR
jgi:hypothetical protein